MYSFEQMKAIAEQCSHFQPSNKNILESSQVTEHGINCTMCEHYNNAKCDIMDEILTNMDQT